MILTLVTAGAAEQDEVASKQGHAGEYDVLAWYLYGTERALQPLLDSVVFSPPRVT
jgi:phage major head subunit gpT-like protein